MRIAVTSPPTSEPVTLAQVKANLRVTHNEQDTMLHDMLIAARQLIEKHLGKRLITQTLQVHFDAREFVPPIVLPYGPVQTLTDVKRWDSDADDFATVTASAYVLAGDRITVSEEADAANWPVSDRVYDAFQTNYDVGYGTASDVPGPIKRAILLTVGDLYTNPETPVGTGLVVGDVPLKASVLIDPYVNYALS